MLSHLLPGCNAWLPTSLLPAALVVAADLFVSLEASALHCKRAAVRSVDDYLFFSYGEWRRQTIGRSDTIFLEDRNDLAKRIRKQKLPYFLIVKRFL